MTPLTIFCESVIYLYLLVHMKSCPVCREIVPEKNDKIVKVFPVNIREASVPVFPLGNLEFKFVTLFWV